MVDRGIQHRLDASPAAAGTPGPPPPRCRALHPGQLIGPEPAGQTARRRGRQTRGTAGQLHRGHVGALPVQRRPARPRRAAATGPARPAAAPALTPRSRRLIDPMPRSKMPTTSSLSTNSASAATPEVAVSDGSAAPIRTRFPTRPRRRILFTDKVLLQTWNRRPQQPRFSKQDKHLRHLTRRTTATTTRGSGSERFDGRSGERRYDRHRGLPLLGHGVAWLPRKNQRYRFERDLVRVLPLH